MDQNAIRATLSLLLLFAPVVTSAQETTPSRRPPPRIACSVGSGALDQAGHRVKGSARKQCDALWTRSLRNGGVAGWRYADFMSQCEQSCPVAAIPAAGVPQLNSLGAQAAAGAGGGFTTALLIGGGVAAVAGVGVAVSHGSAGHSDSPASP